MGIHQLKLVTWLAAIAMGGYLVWDFYSFLFPVGDAEISRRDQVRQLVSAEEQKSVLEDVPVPPEPKREIVDYELVEGGFFDLDWTGTPTAEPVPEEAQEDEQADEPTHVPAEELLDVILVFADMEDEAGSVTVVRYKHAELLQQPRATREPTELRVGDHLPGAFAHVSVARIVPGAVVFHFDLEGLDVEDEVVEPPPFAPTKTLIHHVDPTGVLTGVPGETVIGSIPEPERVPFRPQRTTPVGDNRFRLGTEDVATFERDFPSILARDVQARTHRDRSGRADGIELREIREGSIVAQHGAQEGDVIKSINGHPVTSQQEAIGYVKNQAGTTTHWEVVVENKGRERTVVYESPPQ